jgi:hypothetical protein
MDVRERIARLLTEAESIDPDAKGCGLGVIMPKDEVYPLWKARLRLVEALIKEFPQLEESA